MADQGGVGRFRRDRIVEDIRELRRTIEQYQTEQKRTEHERRQGQLARDILDRELRRIDTKGKTPGPSKTDLLWAMQWARDADATRSERLLAPINPLKTLDPLDAVVRTVAEKTKIRSRVEPAAKADPIAIGAAREIARRVQQMTGAPIAVQSTDGSPAPEVDLEPGTQAAIEQMVQRAIEDEASDTSSPIHFIALEDAALGVAHDMALRTMEEIGVEITIIRDGKEDLRDPKTALTQAERVLIHEMVQHAIDSEEDGGARMRESYEKMRGLAADAKALGRDLEISADVALRVGREIAANERIAEALVLLRTSADGQLYAAVTDPQPDGQGVVPTKPAVGDAVTTLDGKRIGTVVDAGAKAFLDEVNQLAGENPVPSSIEGLVDFWSTKLPQSARDAFLLAIRKLYLDVRTAIPNAARLPETVADDYCSGEVQSYYAGGEKIILRVRFPRHPIADYTSWLYICPKCPRWHGAEHTHVRRTHRWTEDFVAEKEMAQAYARHVSEGMYAKAMDLQLDLLRTMSQELSNLSLPGQSTTLGELPGEKKQLVRVMPYFYDRIVRRGEPFYWNVATAKLIEAAASGLPDTTLTFPMMPAPVGFMYFEHPLDVPKTNEAESYAAPLRALGWSVDQGVASFIFWCISSTGRVRPGAFYSWAFGKPMSDVLHYAALDADAGLVRVNFNYGGRVDRMTRYLVSALLFMQQTILVSTGVPAPRHVRKRAERDHQITWATAPIINVVHLRRKSYATNGLNAIQREVEWHCRWIVRGHWRHQACGPTMTDHRPVWINAYTKGPEDQPIKPPRARVFAVVR